MKLGLFGHKKEEVEIEPYEEMTVDAPEEPVDDYKEVVTRLQAHCKKNESWILVPTLNKDRQVMALYPKKLDEATSAEVACWVAYVCPPLYKSAADVAAYDDQKYRETVFELVIEYNKSIQEAWKHATKQASDFNKGLFT